MFEGKGVCVREPLPDSHPSGPGAVVSLDGLVCESVKLASKDGSSGLVYEGLSRNYYYSKNAAAARIMIKECYPLALSATLVRRGSSIEVLGAESEELSFRKQLSHFRDAFAKHTEIYQGPAREYVSVPGRLIDCNGTSYLISDVSNGVTLDKAIGRMDIGEKLSTLVEVCKAIAAVHETGYAYLDLKPSNVLAIYSRRGGQEAFEGDVRLFDFDASMTFDELERGDGLIMSSGQWSSYEQNSQYSDVLPGRKSDIYSIGALLFWMALGRAPRSAEVLHADGSWVIDRSYLAEDFASLGDGALAKMRAVLEGTLVASPDSRFDTMADLEAALVSLRDVVAPVNDGLREALSKLESSAQNSIQEAIAKDNRVRSARAKKLGFKLLLSLFVCLVVAACGYFVWDATRYVDPAVGEWQGYFWASSSNEELDRNNLDAYLEGALSSEEGFDRNGYVDVGAMGLRVSESGLAELHLLNADYSYHWVYTQALEGKESTSARSYSLTVNDKDAGSMKVINQVTDPGGGELETLALFQNGSPYVLFFERVER